ncbi:hypothetical protein Tco_0513092 [Tanacetum coccineum]
MSPEPPPDHRSTAAINGGQRRSTAAINDGHGGAPPLTTVGPPVNGQVKLPRGMSRQLPRQYVGPMSAHMALPCQPTGSHLHTWQPRQQLTWRRG